MRKNNIILILALLMTGCLGEESQAEDDSLTQEILQAKKEISSDYHPLSIPGMRDRNYSADDFRLLEAVPAGEGLYAQEFSYLSDGLKVYGLIERPTGPPPENGWPVIVLTHGYIPPKQYSTQDNYRMVTRYYARGGFLVVKPDYRGHGRSEGYSDVSATRVFDYTVDNLNLLEGLENIPGADLDNVFIYGHSMGGEIALRIMMIDPDAVKAATIWAPVSDDFPDSRLHYASQDPERLAAFKDKLNEVFSPEEYRQLSLSPFLGSIETPFILHHGTADDSVPLEWTKTLIENLDAAEVEYTYYEYPGEDHNISGSFYQVMDRDMAFFRSFMR